MGCCSFWFRGQEWGSACFAMKLFVAARVTTIKVTFEAGIGQLHLQHFISKIEAFPEGFHLLFRFFFFFYDGIPCMLGHFCLTLL